MFSFLKKRATSPLVCLPSMPPAFVYTVHKAGSMFLHELCAEVAPRLGMVPVSKNDPAFMQRIDERNWRDFIDSFTPPTACFGPIRVRPDKPAEGISESADADAVFARHWPQAADAGSVVIHLRDPRDVLTSLYYSVAYSHKAVPGGFDPAKLDRQQLQKEGVDAHVLSRAPRMLRCYRILCDRFLTRPGVTLVRYEDMVTRFDAWLPNFLAGLVRGCSSANRAVLQPHLERIQAEAYERHRRDFEVGREDVMSHKRQIMPGDHKRKLKPETIARLNSDFADLLPRLGYSPT